MPTFEVGGAFEVADAVAHHLPQSTSPTARKLYRGLVWVGIETTRRKGQSPATTEAVFHVPLELVAVACGISRVSAWRHLTVLKDLGVVDYQPHKGSCRGETRNTGCVWRVRMTPVRGSRARLSFDDLKHHWRDLDQDVRSGRTSQRALKHTKDLQSQLLKFESLLSWTLPPPQQLEPVTSVCFTTPRLDLEAVQDVTGASREDRGRVVDLAAQALAQALRDQGGLDWYRKLLWQLLRRSDATGDDYTYAVYLTALRARVDAREGFARKPGALFVSRLKDAPWWDEVMRGPPTRVGSSPRVIEA